MEKLITQVRGYIASENSRNGIQLWQAQIEPSESYFTRTVSLAKASTPQVERGSGIFAAMYPRIWVITLLLLLLLYSDSTFAKSLALFWKSPVKFSKIVSKVNSFSKNDQFALFPNGSILVKQQNTFKDISSGKTLLSNKEKITDLGFLTGNQILAIKDGYLCDFVDSKFVKKIKLPSQNFKLVSKNKYEILLYDKNSIYELGSKGNYRKIIRTDETITSVTYYKNHIIFSVEDTIFILAPKSKPKSFLSFFGEKINGLSQISDSEILVSTDSGLFLAKDRTVQPVISNKYCHTIQSMDKALVSCPEIEFLALAESNENTNNSNERKRKWKN